MRQVVILTCIVIYGCMLCVEVNLIRTKILGWCYNEKPYPPDVHNKRMFYRFNYGNLLSKTMFSSLNWLFVLGYKQPLEMDDLGCLPSDFECRYVYSVFQQAYDSEKARALKKNRPPSLWKTYMRAYGWPILLGGSIRVLADICLILIPFAIGGVINYATREFFGEEKSTENVCYVTVNEFFSNGYVLVLVICVLTLAKAILFRFAHIMFDWYAIRVQSVLQVVVVITLLYYEMGVSALIGAAFIPVFGVVQYKITDILARLKNLILKTSDTRLKKINELLQGMKLLKLCAWEEMFCSSVEKVREQQVKLMMKSGAYMIVGLSTAKTLTAIVTLISFVSYSLLNPHPLTPELAFVVLAFFAQLTAPISVFARSLRFTAEAIPSMKRIQTFCEAHEIGEAVNGRPPMTRGFEDVDIDEQIVEDCDDAVDSNQGTVLDPSEVSGTYGHNRSKRNILASKTAGQSDSYSLLKSHHHSAYGTFAPGSSVIETALEESDVPEDIALQITDGAFSWNPDGSKDVLTNINIQIPVGSLVMVVGLVGSGKSSLLSAILGEMTTTSGMVQFNRKKNSVSYVPQKPWIQNATLRDNILFGEMFDQKRYSAVIAACALQPDIDILPAGDMTEIGDRGINLSGGQKQRVSMARAMYRKTDTLLLDDPLSALDVHVGSHLVEHGIMDMLVREGRTVILVTHQLQYLHLAKKVVLMDDGKVGKEGNLKEIQLHDPDLFAAWQETLRVLSESERDCESEDERVLRAEDERLDFIKRFNKR
ncbi:ATP-binding cassette sub-family C member 9-like [Ptychodera flava]|uniref:ATP-binding cassette sub-family C member 9-like n=1 Tax=Ptychodera flava TaxID=63121 RepID=UPI003969C5CC